MLVKELQGLGLRVDLLDESEDSEVQDAEAVISSSRDDVSVPADTVLTDELADEVETVLDESDDLGDINDGVSIQDFEEIDKAINEEEEA